MPTMGGVGWGLKVRPETSIRECSWDKNMRNLDISSCFLKPFKMPQVHMNTKAIRKSEISKWELTSLSNNKGKIDLTRLEACIVFLITYNGLILNIPL